MKNKFIKLCYCLIFSFLVTTVYATDFSVILLGTGVPNPRLDRFSQSTLVEAGNQRLIFDFGRGATIRLSQAGIPIGSINAHFLTHFHSDHLVGLPDLWLTGWLKPYYGARKTPFIIYGPVGTRSMMDGLVTAFAEDIKIRLEDEKNPPEGIAVEAHEFIAPAIIYEHDGVKVSAFTVDHGDALKPAVGFKIEYQGRTVVLSGDTRQSEEVIRQATGADLLIHEVAAIQPELLKRSSAYKPIFAHHTSPEQAGMVFSRAKPKLAVYSHIARYGDATTAAPTDKDIMEQTRKTYTGPLIVGKDLMRFDIGDTVTITQISTHTEQ